MFSCSIRHGLGVVCLLTGLAITACDSKANHPTPESCLEARSHVASLSLRHVEVKTDRQRKEIAKHQANLEEHVLGTEFLQSCAKRTPDYVDCVLKADSGETLATCRAKGANQDG